jgi:nitrous oxidase accessory protein NosD
VNTVRYAVKRLNLGDRLWESEHLVDRVIRQWPEQRLACDSSDSIKLGVEAMLHWKCAAIHPLF